MKILITFIEHPAVPSKKIHPWKVRTASEPTSSVELQVVLAGAKSPSSVIAASQDEQFYMTQPGIPKINLQPCTKASLIPVNII